jgi:hypothetical protein
VSNVREQDKDGLRESGFNVNGDIISWRPKSKRQETDAIANARYDEVHKDDYGRAMREIERASGEGGFYCKVDGLSEDAVSKIEADGFIVDDLDGEGGYMILWGNDGER